MNPRSLLFLVFLVLLATSICPLAAQGYDAALGLRIGTGAGLTYAQRIGPKYSLELLGQNKFGTDNFTLAVVGRRHVALGLKRINFYVGAGCAQGLGLRKGRRNGQSTRHHHSGRGRAE